MKNKTLFCGLLALFVFTLTGYQAQAQQGQGGRRNRNQALAVLEGTWQRDSTILDHVLKFDRNGNYELWTSAKDANSRKPSYEGKVELRGNQITFPKAPSAYGTPAVFEFEVDGDFMLLIDPEKPFPITSSGFRTMHFAKNGAETVDYSVSQEGGNSRDKTTTDLTVKFATNQRSAVRDIDEDDISLTPGSDGDAEVDADPTVERGRDGITMTVPIKVNKGGMLRVVILKPGIKFNNKFVTVYDKGPKPQRPPRQRRGGGQAQAAPPPPPPPQQEPPRGKSNFSADDVKVQKNGNNYTFAVKALFGESVNQSSNADQIENYQVEVAQLGRNTNARNADRADWIKMADSFKGEKVGRYGRAFGSTDGYSFVVTDTVRANVYGQRARPGTQPVIVRVRAKTSDRRGADWGEWVYFLNDGQGY